MNSKERVLDCFEYKPIDRIGRFDQFWKESEGIFAKHFGLDDKTSLESYLDIDIVKMVVNEEPLFTKARVISENGNEIIRQNGWGMVERVFKKTNFPEELEPLVKTPKDIDKLEFDDPALDVRYANIRKTMDGNKDRAVFAKIGGPFLRTEQLRGKVQYLMDIAEDPEMVFAMAEKVNDHLTAIGKEALRRGVLYDTGIWIFDDMAYNAGPLISPRSFESIFLPLYKKLVAELKKAGAKYVLFHSDGNIGPLLDMLLDAGIDGINPIEPRAGMSIPALQRKYGRKFRYIGGMCNSDVLVNGPKERIIERTREIIDAAKDGGVIIGSHSIGPDIPVENYMVYMQTVLKYGSFNI